MQLIPLSVLFFFLYIQKKVHASFGNRLLSCDTSLLFHINVGIIVMPSDLSLQPFCQQHVPSSMRVCTHVPSSSIFGPLKGLSP